jgi:hypothetical protein
MRKKQTKINFQVTRLKSVYCELILIPLQCAILGLQITAVVVLFKRITFNCSSETYIDGKEKHFFSIESENLQKKSIIDSCDLVKDMTGLLVALCVGGRASIAHQSSTTPSRCVWVNLHILQCLWLPPPNYSSAIRLNHQNLHDSSSSHTWSHLSLSHSPARLPSKFGSVTRDLKVILLTNYFWTL